MSLFRTLVIACVATMAAACSREPAGKSVAPEGGWISLLNGKNLDGWTVKIRGRRLGEDPAHTFRVHPNGHLRVDYSGYADFGTSNGMLIYEQPLTRYWLRAEYRFVGEVARGAPAWAPRDSGIQFHGQNPSTVALDQEFPVGLEINLLGGKLMGRARPTGNVCTNGVVIEIDGAPLAGNCSTTSATTIRMPDQWVRLEAKIDEDAIEHWVNGNSVVRYSNPRLDDGSALAANLIAGGAARELRSGYLSIQSNGAPIEFRRLEILPIL